MIDEGQFRRRELPHLDIDGKPVFITACLEGSICSAGLSRIREFREKINAVPRPSQFTADAWKLRNNKLVFKLVDSILDGQPPARHLADERLAQVVQDAFLHFAGNRYDLYAFVVMPSHYHWLFLPRAAWCEQLAKGVSGQGSQRTPREVISHSIQSFTSQQCNRILGRNGPFWQAETYDHSVRTEDEFYRIIEYIELNPVVAGLTATPEEYRWSSSFFRKSLGSNVGDPLRKVQGLC